MNIILTISFLSVESMVPQMLLQTITLWEDEESTMLPLLEKEE